MSRLIGLPESNIALSTWQLTSASGRPCRRSTSLALLSFGDSTLALTSCSAVRQAVFPRKYGALSMNSRKDDKTSRGYLPDDFDMAVMMASASITSSSKDTCDDSCA